MPEKVLKSPDLGFLEKRGNPEPNLTQPKLTFFHAVHCPTAKNPRMKANISVDNSLKKHDKK